MSGKSAEDVYLPVRRHRSPRRDTAKSRPSLIEPDQILRLPRRSRRSRESALRHADASVAARVGARQQGAERRLELVLKLIADVGLLAANAGKSTLLCDLGGPPKIADYPFTTWSRTSAWSGCRTTVVRRRRHPGIIEGAHEGRGWAALSAARRAHTHSCRARSMDSPTAGDVMTC